MRDDTRIALVLGAGGARGVALAGVLRRLREERIRFGTVLGCSVGAIVAGLYAAARMEPEEMIDRAGHLGPGSLFAFAVSRWRLPFLSDAALRRSAPIVEGLERLEAASFSRLRDGITTLGVLTYDLRSRAEVLIHGGPEMQPRLPLAAAVKASAAIPGLFPPLRVRSRHGGLLLVDAGWHTAVPIERAFARPIGARRVIAVDLGLRTCLRQARRSYWEDLQEACGDRLVVLRPAVRRFGTMLPRRGDAEALAAAGEECLHGEALRTVRAWQSAAPEGGSHRQGRFLDPPGGGC